jgi:tRNA dimethylallyltransferase
VPPTLPPVLFIVGPTAAGKTALALSLAQRFHGQIINADSRQVYRGMDIGTAKPTAAERRVAPHHLLDILDPAANFSLGEFLRLARRHITDIAQRGHLPIVAGGTGQYVWALIEGWQVPEVPPDPQLRQTLEQHSAEQGPLALHQELAALDSQRAAQLDPRNLRRVIRALEVQLAGQHRAQSPDTRVPPDFQPLIIGLTLAREELYRRIDRRVEQMMAAGFLDEVRRLAEAGYLMGAGPLASPGYRELGLHLAGEISLAEAVQRTKFQTHRLARRQYTWFKLGDPRIHWLDAGDAALAARAGALVSHFLSSHPGAAAVIE